MTPDKMKNLPKSDFISHLVAVNHLDRIGFDRFVFFPGMCFLSMDMWWAGAGRRKTAHEGLDICFFINSRNKAYRLDETVRIPALFQGRMIHVMRDFLGHTLVIRHRMPGDDSNTILSFYAHILPDEKVGMGHDVEAGQVIGTIVDPHKTHSPLPAHLHLSLARESGLPDVSTLSWKILNQVDRSVLIDPMRVLPEKHCLWEKAPDEQTMHHFIKCSLALSSNQKVQDDSADR